MPEVSVIFPTRNRENFLLNSLGSLLNQTFRNFEIVVFDDASADKTRSIISSFKDSRIRYVYSPYRVGASNARRQALGLAKGEFIIYADDDDIMQPDCLDNLLKALRADRSVGLVYADALFSFPKKRAFLPFSVDFNKDRLEIDNYIINFYLHRKSCLQGIKGWEKSDVLNKHGLQDWDFLLQLSDKFKFKHIPKIGGRHVYHGGNISLTKKRYLSYAYIIKKRLRKHSLDRGQIPFRGYVVSILENFYHRFNGSLKLGEDILSDSIANFPFEPEVYLAACLNSIKKGNTKKSSLFLNEALKLNESVVRSKKLLFEKELLRLNINIVSIFLKYGAKRDEFYGRCNRIIISSISRLQILSNPLTQAVRRFILNNYLKEDIMREKVCIWNNIMK